ncbi:carbohydrate kinase [Streptomyces achromogenes]|uniref:carbohydrate kinase family protein n=1 Tax=Streptomyces achromogenes TaxID=67255 RepID=UPI0036B83366
MIVVAGEALIDLVPHLGRGPLAPLVPKPGGGPYNTAIALGRLGEPTAFLSRISRDTFGQELLEGLRAAGVDVSHVQRGDEPTPLALAALGPDGSARYSFHVEGTADRLFTAPAELPQGTRAMAFGTCSLVLEPGASAYEELLHRAHAHGVCTALDPNIRPDLMPDAGAYRSRLRSWLPGTTLLKVSQEDLDWLGDDPGFWLGLGPAAVVVTRGGEGLSVLTRVGEVSVPVVPVPVADTIGAGDTVNAALLHQLSVHNALGAEAMAALDEQHWRDILGFAARAAAVTVSRVGAEPPYARELAG